MHKHWSHDDAEALLVDIDASSTNNCLKVASALRREFGDSGAEMFLDWCKTAHNWNEQWARTTYRRADTTRAGMGLLVTMARSGGF